MDQEENTEKYGNDDGPNHRERTEDNNEAYRCQRMLSKSALDCDHHALLRVLPTHVPLGFDLLAAPYRIMSQRKQLGILLDGIASMLWWYPSKDHAEKNAERA